MNLDPESIIAQLDTDLHAIDKRLAHSLRDLDGPLGELVRPQLGQIQPLVRAGVVLTTAFSVAQKTNQPAATPQIHALAAAVEMLYIALSLHKRLIRPAPPQPSAQTAGNARPTTTNSHTGDSRTGDTAPEHRADKNRADENRIDKTFLGSTILAGDYCFSRASQLAAETENPQVVAHFAQTLQALSEGLLREQFQTTDQAPDHAYSHTYFNEDSLLLLSGAEAALLLHQVPVETPLFDQSEFDQSEFDQSEEIATSHPASADLPHVNPEPNKYPVGDSSIHEQTLNLARTFAQAIQPQGDLAPASTPTTSTQSLTDPHGSGLEPYWSGLYAWWQRNR